MYSTCLFCNNALGQNDAIEHFSVGRRLAYDAAKGRLWVVCKQCERWNLSPLETRWEAIEECERAFRGTKLRVSTDNVGLAQLADGLQLVRIGAPLRPEFAAWRYGDQFGKRRRKYLAMAAIPIVGGIAASVGPYFGLMAMGIGTGLSWASMGSRFIRNWRDGALPKASVRNNEGKLLRLTAMDIRQTQLLNTESEGEWRLRITHSKVAQAHGLSRWFGQGEIAQKPLQDLSFHEQMVATGRITNLEPAKRANESSQLTGPAAERALATILPHINSSGGNKKQVQEAVELASASKVVRELLHGLPVANLNTQVYRTRSDSIGLGAFPASLRLALEMSLHEEDERRAMEGELLQLEERWRDAELIAKIADDMFVPQSINERVKSFGIHDADSH